MPTSRRYKQRWRRQQRIRATWRTAGTVRAVSIAAIPVAVIAVVGGIIATSGNGDVGQISQSALGDCVSASAAAPGGSASAPAVSGSAGPSGADGSASAAPCPSGSGGSTASGSTAPATTGGTQPGRPDLAGANPVDPTGAAISLNQTPAEAADSLNCTLTVPASPLSARGLATPWQLGDGCTEANPDEQAFVEATILSPHGQVTVYDPLVVTRGTSPAVTPSPPALPRGAQVIINTGFNGNNLVLEGAGAAQGRCVDAYGNSIISQTASCNASAFFAAANSEIARDVLTIPALGTASDGKACESTESFSLIDQDQSDNVISQYLLDKNGRTAQDTAANQKAMGDAGVITNGSDDALLGHFIDPALGCTPLTAADPTSPDGSDSSQALNSLSARLGQGSPRALLPVNDPQLLVGGQFSVGKTNTFRAESDQPLLPARTNLAQNAASYCQDMVNIQPARLKQDAARESGSPSPVPDTGNNLATFMGARLAASFGNLGCQDYGLRNPVTVTTDKDGVATAVRYDTTLQHATVPRTMPSGGKGGGYDPRVPAGRHHHRENGAGM